MLSAGCGRSDAPETAGGRQAPAGQAAAPAGTDLPRGQDLTVTGCLTASIEGQSYALTPTDVAQTATQGGARPTSARPTFTYELVGSVEDFRRHANTVVTARGREDASVRKDADVTRKSEATSKPAAGAGATPTVEVKEEAAIEVRRLHVTSVVPTGNTCPSFGPQQRRP